MVLVILLCAPSVRAQDDGALPALVQVLGQTDDPQFQLDVLKGMAEALKGRRDVKMPAGWEGLSDKLAKSPSAPVRELAQSLSVTFGSAAALDVLRRQMLDARVEPEKRKVALESLVAAKAPQLAVTLRRLLADTTLRGPALRALATFDDPATPEAILAVYGALNPGDKKDALTTLASRTAFANALLAAIRNGQISVKDLSADIVRTLRNLKSDEIVEEVEKLWGVTRDSPEDKLREAAKYKAIVLAKGVRAPDPSRGRAAFARTCQQCHTLFGAGGKVGPDLTGSNRADLDYILHNIIDPNAEIPNDYRAWLLETKDGRTISGIITRQDAQTVTIITPAETLTLPRTDLETLTQSQLSMMPEGLIATFSDDDLRDLISYLASKEQVAAP
jgi:putative heme-binding domain-containing protein